MTYVCADCGGPVHSSYVRENVERTVGPKQEQIKPAVRGLGTWTCGQCGGKVKVKRSK